MIFRKKSRDIHANTNTVNIQRIDFLNYFYNNIIGLVKGQYNNIEIRVSGEVPPASIYNSFKQSLCINDSTNMILLEHWAQNNKAKKVWTPMPQIIASSVNELICDPNINKGFRILANNIIDYCIRANLYIVTLYCDVDVYDGDIFVMIKW